MGRTGHQTYKWWLKVSSATNRISRPEGIPVVLRSTMPRAAERTQLAEWCRGIRMVLDAACWIELADRQRGRHPQSFPRSQGPRDFVELETRQHTVLVGGTRERENPTRRQKTDGQDPPRSAGDPQLDLTSASHHNCATYQAKA